MASEINCALCGELIVKYSVDAGDTIGLKIKDEWKYICETCMSKIIMDIIKERFDISACEDDFEHYAAQKLSCKKGANKEVK